MDPRRAINPLVVRPRQFLRRGIAHVPDQLLQQLDIHRRRPPTALRERCDAAGLAVPHNPPEQRPGFSENRSATAVCESLPVSYARTARSRSSIGYGSACR